MAAFAFDSMSIGVADFAAAAAAAVVGYLTDSDLMRGTNRLGGVNVKRRIRRIREDCKV